MRLSQHWQLEKLQGSQTFTSSECLARTGCSLRDKLALIPSASPHSAHTRAPNAAGCNSCKLRPAHPSLTLGLPWQKYSSPEQDVRPSKSTRMEFLELLFPFQGKGEHFTTGLGGGLNACAQMQASSLWTKIIRTTFNPALTSSVSTWRQVHRCQGLPGVSPAL